MIATVLLVLLWLLIILQAVGAVMALCNTVRYRDVMVDLDADRVAHQPFQPRISLIIRWNPKTDQHPVRQIQEAISLNYIRYEVILIADSEQDPAVFAEVVGHFEMKSLPVPGMLEELRYPARGFYRSRSALYKRLTVIDKVFHPDDDLRLTGATICQADYMVFVRSLDNELIRNSLSNLAIMKMRSPREPIASIRGAARYSCDGPLKKNFFLLLTELCNLRRMYVIGKFKNNDFGQYVTLENVSGKKGTEEMVPVPQMYIHRPNTFRTYMLQLAPHIRYKTRTGKFFSYLELLIGIIFWGAAIHVIATPGIVNKDFTFMLTALLLPLLASTFAILVGEIFLKENFKIRFVCKLLLLSFLEAIVFCFFLPWIWIMNQVVKTREV